MAAPDLERLLAELLEPDSDVIRRTPARLGLLLTGSSRAQIRQLAAVLLRRRLLGRWKRLDPALRQRLPTLLAEALERETEHTVTVVLAQLGALVLRRGGLSAWGPLGTWVQEVARDPRPPHQEELLRSLLPDILTALKKLLDADEERGTEALEVLDEFLEADPSTVTPHLRPLLDLCLQVTPGGLGALFLRRGGLSAWGPLGTWVQEVARDPRPPHQEAALLVLSAALEAAPQVLAPHGPALAALCRGALAPGVPPSPPAYSLQALGGLGAMLGDTHTELLRSLLPDILTALKKLLDADEERGTEALEVLDEFLEANPATVTPHLRPLLDLCLQVAGDECWGDAVRVRALATVTFLAQKRPKALLRGGLLGQVLGGLLIQSQDSSALITSHFTVSPTTNNLYYYFVSLIQPCMAPLVQEALRRQPRVVLTHLPLPPGLVSCRVLPRLAKAGRSRQQAGSSKRRTSDWMPTE
ncbi:importin-4-like [Grus americana]|uniref:importin-4-like n=1 Tax=Grus americana TaxID=9117 RepID=UPI002407A8CF|nr:importin-4-like [Grus americana]